MILRVTRWSVVECCLLKLAYLINMIVIVDNTLMTKVEMMRWRTHMMTWLENEEVA